MRIAVIDVAAESGGALSVLNDFLYYLVSLEHDNNEYYVFVSQKLNIEKENIHYIIKPEIKRSWFSRLKWERIDAQGEFDELNIDLVFSLQNTGFYSKKIKQIVYFHNVLLLESKKKYSIWNKEQRKYAIYTKAIAPYTIASLKYADTIICQTKTICADIKNRLPDTNVVAVYPNVHVDEEYRNTANELIKGFIYPTSPVPFKRVESIIECVKEHNNWFEDNNLEMLITIKGDENAYASKLLELSRGCEAIKLIGYQTRERIMQLYQDHVLIVNSELESFPLLFLEKSIIGGAVISADYAYAIEITGKLPNVEVYKKENMEDMFEKMKWAISYGSNYDMDSSWETNSWEKVIEIINNSCRGNL